MRQRHPGEIIIQEMWRIRLTSKTLYGSIAPIQEIKLFLFSQIFRKKRLKLQIKSKMWIPGVNI